MTLYSEMVAGRGGVDGYRVDPQSIFVFRVVPW
jgi:hypothetical protein